MAELQVNDGVKLTGLPEGWANAQALQQVILWDIGPEKPKYPQRLVAPKGKEGDPEFDLAVVEFKDQLEEYQAALKTYRQAKKEFEDWAKRHGGPIEIPFWSCDAQDALANDARAVAEGRQTRVRFYLSARTRGYSKLPNRGLPEIDGKPLRPGHGQAELERRQREGDADMAAALRADPVFGNPELRQ
jgi:hypothetical protein